MACKKPILLSSQLDASASNFVEKNKIGFVCDVNDKKSFEKIVLDKKILKSMADNGYKLVEDEYSCSAVAKKYLELIKNV